MQLNFYIFLCDIGSYTTVFVFSFQDTKYVNGDQIVVRSTVFYVCTLLKYICTYTHTFLHTYIAYENEAFQY